MEWTINRTRLRGRGNLAPTGLVVLASALKCLLNSKLYYKLTHCIGKVFTSVVNIATILIDIKITTDGLMEYTLENCQKIVDEWVNSVGVRYFSELTNTAILMEEVGELARIMARRFGDQSFKDNEEDLNLADEIADILFVLICLANQTGVQLEDAFRQSILKKTDRDRDRHANNPKLFSDSGAKE